MCFWKQKLYQGCGCLGVAEKTGGCQNGNCNISTRDPRQQTRIENVGGKCAIHTHQMTPSSSEGSFTWPHFSASALGREQKDMLREESTSSFLCGTISCGIFDLFRIIWNIVERTRPLPWWQLLCSRPHCQGPSVDRQLTIYAKLRVTVKHRLLDTTITKLSFWRFRLKSVIRK